MRYIFMLYALDIARINMFIFIKLYNFCATHFEKEGVIKLEVMGTPFY
jgi:hypothetical protein